MALGIKNLVMRTPVSEYKPGDVFITNDPWALAGHLNDVCVMSPIFYEHKVVAFIACVSHHSDIGGRVSSDNHDVFEEGLFIPLVKLYDGGVLNESVMEMIRWNVRTPDEVIGDIRSQIAANHVCADKVGRMLRENHLSDLDDLADEIIGRTEKSMREEIAKVPDGLYRAESIVEQTKGSGDVVIKAAVRVKGSDISVDLSGSSPQVNWGGNVVFNFTYAYVFMAMKSMFGPDIPNNDGCARPLHLTAPEGSVVNCRFPAAVASPARDRPLPHGDHYQGIVLRHAVQGDSGERRHSCGNERLLRKEEQRQAVALGSHKGRRHGRRQFERRQLRVHIPGERRGHPGGDFRGYSP